MNASLKLWPLYDALRLGYKYSESNKVPWELGLMKISQMLYQMKGR